MFQLENDNQKQFYLETKLSANLDEEQLNLLETYHKNIYLSRHIELQILEWENSRFYDDLSQHQDNKSIVIEEVEEIKHKCESSEKNLISLAEYQNSLNEQINEMIMFKQPVQPETTYLMTNRRYVPSITASRSNGSDNTFTSGSNMNTNPMIDSKNNSTPRITTTITGMLPPSTRGVKKKSSSSSSSLPPFTTTGIENMNNNKSSTPNNPPISNKASTGINNTKNTIKNNNDTMPFGNIYLSPTSNSPKLTYDAFTKQLYSCDSIRIEHLIKNENDIMLNGLLTLERSIHQVLHEIDSVEIDPETYSNMITVDSLIQKINENDRLSYLTYIETLQLKKRLHHTDTEKSHQIKQILKEANSYKSKIEYLQTQSESTLTAMNIQYKTDLEVMTKQLNQQKRKLMAKLHFLNRRQYRLVHPEAKKHQKQRAHELFDANNTTNISNNNENKHPNSRSRGSSSSSRDESKGKLGAIKVTNKSSKIINNYDNNNDGGYTHMSSSHHNNLSNNNDDTNNDASVILNAQRELQIQVEEAKHSYQQLERRNRLEMEGYENEIMFLRRKLKQLEKVYS